MKEEAGDGLRSQKAGQRGTRVVPKGDPSILIPLILGPLSSPGLRGAPHSPAFLPLVLTLPTVSMHWPQLRAG